MMRIPSYISNFSKKNFWFLAKAICFMGILLLILNKVSYILSAKESYEIKQDFYNSEQKYEVLLMGTSHMYNGIYPMELYRDFGISSYNLAVAGERFSATYWSLKDALQYGTPKVVVLDMHALEYGDNRNDPEVPRRLHVTLDAFKMGLVKIGAIQDVVDRDMRPEYYFPLTLYHNRWSKLEELDFCNDIKNVAKGGEFNMNIVVSSPPGYIAADDYVNVNSAAVDDLKKIITLCKENNIEVLLINIPYNAADSQRRIDNYATILAEEYGIEYIDMFCLLDEIGINYATDMADATSHLNPLGARKVTKFIGEYLEEHYDVTDFRKSAESLIWEKDYKEYMEYKVSYLKEQDELALYLMLLADEDYQYCAAITEPEDFFENTLYADLIKTTLCVDKVDIRHEALGMLLSNMNDQIIMTCDKSAGIITKCHEILFAQSQGHGASVGLSVDSNPCKFRNAAVTIVVIDKVTDEIVDLSNWDAQGMRMGVN